MVNDPLHNPADKFDEFQRSANEVRTTYESGWERFSFTTLDPGNAKFIETLTSQWEDAGSLLDKAEAALDEVKQFSTQMLGKKSLLANLKKRIGTLPDARRGEAGQLIQLVESAIKKPLLSAEDKLIQL
ncbi:MAG: hypothetical protein DMF71_10180, partial [Acidobacteria bacterium]